MDWTPRQYPRYKAALPVEMRPLAVSVPLRGQTEDISMGGFYVEITFTQPVSTELNITLWVGDTKLHARGVVVSNHPAFGNGIKFTEVGEADKESLKRFLESLAGQRSSGRTAVR